MLALELIVAASAVESFQFQCHAAVVGTKLSPALHEVAELRSSLPYLELFDAMIKRC